VSNYLRAEDTVGAPDIVGILEMVAVVYKDDRRSAWIRYPNKIPKRYLSQEKT